MIRDIRRFPWPCRLLLLLTVGLFAACSNNPVSVESSSQDLRDIGRIEELQEMFNRDVGVSRLILLLSPT